MTGPVLMRIGGSPFRRAVMAVASSTLALAAACTQAHAQARPTLPALNSYLQPPFMPVNERGQGLAALFVEQMNEALPLGRRLHLENLPRRRLELALEGREFAGVALFLAPEFLARAAQQGGAWSVPVMVDENLLVSTRPLQVASLDDLHGLRFGGIAGHIYRALGPLVDDRRLEREDAVDHLANLKKLCLGRVDFIVISRSELAGTEPQAQCLQAFRPLAFPQPQIIVRRVLVRLPGDAEAQQLLDAVARVACGERWTAALARHGLSTVGCQRRELPASPAANRRKAPPVTPPG
jgi:polar amino acid transport system substrate-binding protein